MDDEEDDDVEQINSENDPYTVFHQGLHIHLNPDPEKVGIFNVGRRKLQDGTYENYCYKVIDAYVDPFELVKYDGSRLPYLNIRIGGREFNAYVGDLSQNLKSVGYPIYSDYKIQSLTKSVEMNARNNGIYAEPGYLMYEDISRTEGENKDIVEKLSSVTDEKIRNAMIKYIRDNHIKFKFRLIEPKMTVMKLSPQKNDLNNMPSLDEVVHDLYNLYQLTADKRAFVMAFSYSLFSPFAVYVRSQRMFFPNMVLLGIPETGKNSLANLFMSTMWGIENNIKVTEDFRTEYAAMKNLEGGGMGIVINDINDKSYDKLKPLILEGAMNPKSGSRGKATLELAQFESVRGILITANFLNLGSIEHTSRLLIHQMNIVPSDNTDWNNIASHLKYGMYPIAKYFIDWINNNMDAVQFLDYFKDSRLEVKRTIIQIGSKILQDVLSIVDPSFTIDKNFTVYDEYVQDYSDILIGWTQHALRKMQKEQNYYDSDGFGRGVVTISYTDTLYIQETKDQYILFNMAFSDFVKRYPEFPYQSMEMVSKAYPDIMHYVVRKYKVGKERKSFRVLAIDKVFEEYDQSN